MASTHSITYVSSYVEYPVIYDGKTIETIDTNQGSVAEEWANELLLVHDNNPKVVIVTDCKWNSCDYSSIQGLNEKCATLQLCIDTKCLILRLFYMNEIPQSFKSSLMNPKFTFMGVDRDLSKLISEYSLDCVKSENIRAAVIRKWPRRFQRHNFTYLAKQLAGLEVKYPDGTDNNWGERVLDDKQVEYACSSAYASYKIGHKLFY